jgi:proteasome assembly chaperone (PAC2) family protein
VLAADGEVVARFDSDKLYDYRMLRPTIDFRDGVLEKVDWPEMTVRRVTMEGRDVLVLSGPEPNWNWQRMAAELVQASKGWGILEVVGMGGVPWAAPHTRPVMVMTTSTDGDRLQSWPDHPEGLLQVPGAAVSALEFEFHRAGFATIGFWARVPNYVGAPYPEAARALLEKVGVHLGVSFGFADLEAQAQEQADQLDTAISERPDVQAMVEQLQQAYDSATAVSGDDLAAEIERFLREQR